MPSLPETRASLIVRLPDAADARAWDDFVAVYAPLVYGLARRYGLQPADADDVVQDVLAAVARSVDTWLKRPDRGPFRAWLLRIARNLAINAITRPKSRPLAAGGNNDQRVSQHADNGDTASQFDLEYRRELFRWAADQAREHFSDASWQAFWLSTVENQPIAAVAQRLNLTVGSVYIARSRVMARLRETVQQFDERSP